MESERAADEFDQRGGESALGVAQRAERLYVQHAWASLRLGRGLNRGFQQHG